MRSISDFLRFGCIELLSSHILLTVSRVSSLTVLYPVYPVQENDNEKTREQPVDKQNLSNGHASSTDQNPEQETAAKGARKRRDLSAERELTVGHHIPCIALFEYVDLCRK